MTHLPPRRMLFVPQRFTVDELLRAQGRIVETRGSNMGSPPDAASGWTAHLGPQGVRP
jgi:hypothetical protein